MPHAVVRALVAFVFLFTVAPRVRAQTAWAEAQQIHWQRSLEDAWAIARAEGRPLLVVLHMDGESACERIVRERYRDPGFVAWTRSFVCVVGSVFRHAARDYDEEGRRVPCPRLGEVTCGEHIALEPAIFEGHLAQEHERVAPRHALLLPDGTKAWDLYLLFDLGELDQRLATSAREVGERPRTLSLAPAAGADWSALVGGTSQRARAALEARLSGERDADQLVAGVRALGARQDAGLAPAFRAALGRLERAAPELAAALEPVLVASARSAGLATPVAELARARVRSPGRFGGSFFPSGEERLLPVLAALDGANVATRSLLLACAALPAYGASVRPVLEAQLGGTDWAAPLEAPPAWLQWRAGGTEWMARRAPEDDGALQPWVEPPLLEAAEYESALQTLEGKLATASEDPHVVSEYGLACLGLARRRLETQQAGADLLLQDAERSLTRALELARASGREYAVFSWQLARARAAYLLGRFEEQAQAGIEAAKLRCAAAPERDRDARYIEALRWVGDARARQIAERALGRPRDELAGIAEGLAALCRVAASPHAKPDDWLSFSSFYGAYGLWREELAILQEGARRFPAAQELRTRLNNALWSGGRVDLAGPKADWIAESWPQSADAAWFAGFGWVLVAEHERRGERPAAAIAAYERARQRFARSIELNADYADNARHYIALAWFGRGMAHLLADDRAAAARDLVEAVRTRPAIAGARDGLDREPLDLLDQALEWRASGPSPVEALALLDELERADPRNAFWARAVSDSELREALRADGRAPGARPGAEGDLYLRASIAAARRACVLADSDEDRRALSQALTIWAERRLELGRGEEGRAELLEAAALWKLTVADPLGEAELRDLAAQLRGLIGEPRPLVRPGR